MGFERILAASLCALGFAAVQAQSTDSMTVHFSLNQSVLQREDQATLDRRFGAAGPRIKSIELAGHCDSVGENQYNDSLARQRVGVVKKYLLSKGIADTLFKELYSYGKRKPLNDNGDEEKRSLNRRVTITWRFAEQPTASSPLRDALRDTTGVIGKTILLPNVLFYGDMHRPMPISTPTLQDLFAIMKEHPGLRVEIQGHVCCMPENMDGLDIETHKNDLSVRRAEYVYAYLVRRGIDTSRITYRGFGASRKIFPQESDEGQMMRNRRVEIKILTW
jgi:outer membrane protein OmpA-like peptidoglycan-associated protein